MKASRPFTDADLKRFKPGPEKQEHSDSTGLRVRVSPSGVRSLRWVVLMPTGRQRVITLGQWSAIVQPGFLTVNQARVWLDHLKAARRGDQLDAALARLEAETRPARVTQPSNERTVRDVATEFMAALKRKRPEQAQLPIDNDIIPAIGDREIRSVTAEDGRRIVKAVLARGASRQAAVVLAILKQLFDFAVDDLAIDANPMLRLKAKTFGISKSVSKRVLTDAEIVKWWRALDEYKGLSPVSRCGLKILLLTGVRSGELLQARVSEVDLERALWTIPVENQKLTLNAAQTAEPWQVPLSPSAVDLFKQLHALASGCGSAFIMPSFSAANAGGHLTDKALIHAMRRLFIPYEKGAKPLLTFAEPRPTPHDLRRTFRTGLSALRVPHDVAERCLNHKLGEMTHTYNQDAVLKQRREAVERWADHVAGLLNA